VYQALIVVLFKRVSPLVQSDFQIKSFMRKSNAFADRKDFGTIGNDTDDDVGYIVDSIIAKIKRRFLLAYESDSNVKKFFIQNFNDIQIKSKLFICFSFVIDGHLKIVLVFVLISVNGNIENVTADFRLRQDGIEESPFVATPTQTAKSKDLTKVPPTALPSIQTNQTQSETTANQLSSTMVNNKTTIEPTKSDTTSKTTTTSTTIETTDPTTESTIISTSTNAITAPTSTTTSTRTSSTIEKTTESTTISTSPTTTSSRKIEFTEQITTTTTLLTPVTAPTAESTITMPTKQSTEPANSKTQTSATVEPTVQDPTIAIATTDTTQTTIITSTSTNSSTVTTVAIGSTSGKTIPTMTTTTTADIHAKSSSVASESTLATTSTTSTTILETSTITKSTLTTEETPIVSLKTVLTTTKTSDNITTSLLTTIQASDSTNIVEPVSVNYLNETFETTNLSSLSSNLLETTTTTTVAYSPITITDKHVAKPIEKNSLAQRQYLAKLKHLSTGLEKTKSKAYFNQQAENTNQVKLKTSQNADLMLQNTENLAKTMHQSSSTQPDATILATMAIDFNSSTTAPLIMEPSTIQATTASILADAKRRKLIKIFKNSRQE
jgi:hypothetical protein